MEQSDLSFSNVSSKVQTSTSNLIELELEPNF